MPLHDELVSQIRETLQGLPQDHRDALINALDPEVQAQIRGGSANLPETVPFKYYLHDKADHYERLDQISRSAEIVISDELGEKIGRPFYEVTLNCELNTETGKVTILSVEA